MIMVLSMQWSYLLRLGLSVVCVVGAWSRWPWQSIVFLSSHRQSFALGLSGYIYIYIIYIYISLYIFPKFQSKKGTPTARFISKAHGPGSFAAATCWRFAWPLPISAVAGPGRDEQETTCTALRNSTG